jgi:predicted O-methyltransferase YrrM
MKFLLGIPYVNSPELLARAVNSVCPLWSGTYIVDNSPNGLNWADWPVEVLRPPVPLSLSQTVNLLARKGEQAEADVIFYMHHDAEAAGGACDRFISIVESALASHRPWGIAFTNYDSLAAFSAAAMRYVGPWDVSLPKPFAETDFYRRVRLAGYEALETGVAVQHPNDGGSTLLADGGLAFLNAATFPFHRQYYHNKWGGPLHRETFDWAFDGLLTNAYVQGLRREGVYGQLMDGYEARPNGILECGDDRTHAAQVEILRAEMALNRTRRVLETGTNKAMLGYLLSHLGAGITLFTFDSDPRCNEAVEILNRSQTRVRAIFTAGGTGETLKNLTETDIDLACIHGGRELATVPAELEQAMRLRAKTILVNDTKAAPEIAAAVRGTLAGHPEYVHARVPLSKYDLRGLAVLRRVCSAP